MRLLNLNLRNAAKAVTAVLVLCTIFFMPGPQSVKSQTNDIEEIDALLDEFEEVYSGKRTNDLRLLFFSDAVIAVDLEEGESQTIYELNEWLEKTDENIFQLNDFISDSLTNREIVVLRNIAYATCNYTYIDETHRSQGIDIFTFMKMHDRWRIVSLQWTGDQVEVF